MNEKVLTYKSAMLGATYALIAAISIIVVSTWGTIERDKRSSEAAQRNLTEQIEDRKYDLEYEKVKTARYYMIQDVCNGSGTFKDGLLDCR